MRRFSGAAPARLIALGNRAREARQWDIAAQYYGKSLNQNPRNSAIWVQYGHALKESGHLADATVAYRRALAAEPEVADTHLQLGHVLKLQGKTEEAKAAYLQSLVLFERLSAEPVRELAELSSPSNWPAASPSGVIRILYRALLNREPDEDGFEHYLGLSKSGEYNIHDLACMIMRDSEFVSKNFEILARLPCSIGFDKKWHEDTQNYYNAIAASGVSLDYVHKVYAAADLEHDEYTVFHIKRFHEIFGYLKHYVKHMSRKPTVLEIGPYVHITAFYHNFFEAEWDTISRPAALGWDGLTPEWWIKAKTRRRWEIDLNHPERYSAVLADIPDRYYDIVICTEVIEHLTRPPRETIGLAVSKLKPDGLMYLTTPNHLRPDLGRAVLSGYGAAETFLLFGDNLSGGHHFREYTPKEIIDETACIPARVKGVSFSNCWDGEKFSTKDEAMFRSNLVFIIAP